MGEVTSALTIGTFDQFHVGHQRLFQRIASYADDVIIGINTDQSPALNQKQPSQDQAIRYRHVARYVAEQGWSHVNVTFSFDRGRTLVNFHKPDMVVVGSDWAPPKDFLAQIEVSQQELDHWDVSLLFVPRTPGVSSTQIRKRLSAAPYRTDL